MCLDLSGITFTYPGADAPVLRDVSLSVSAGESVAVMAPSGVGKTTLLSVAGLLLTPAKGEVRIGGVARRQRDAVRMLGTEISWVLQTVSLLPRRNVVDNVAVPQLAQGAARPDARSRAREVLTVVGLATHASREARTLSGGEQQRVGVARALVAGPVVVLADEPTANMDGQTALIVMQALVDASRCAALVVATHDPRVAELADRTVRLRGGYLEDVA